MKLIVTPLGPHGYMDPTTGDEVQPFRPSVVQHSSFIDTLIGSSKIKLIANDLSDEASDKEFALYYRESGKDVELAVESFLSSFAKPKDEEKEASKKAKAEELEASVKAKALAAEEKEAKEKAEATAKAKAAKANEQKKD